MKHSITACAWIAAMTISYADDAPTGRWAWGCMGPLGENAQIVFNRHSLIVAPAQPPRGELHDLIFFEDSAKTTPTSRSTITIRWVIPTLRRSCNSSVTTMPATSYLDGDIVKKYRQSEIVVDLPR